MLLISDANVLIDFDCCDLLPKLFQLPHDLAVPDILFIEELEARHPELPDLGLQVLEMDATVIEDALKLKTRYSNPSTNDLLAMTLAKSRKCTLVTGDSRLRKAAKKEGVELRGTIWLAEQLLTTGLVTARDMQEAFDTMRDAGSRLPWKECDRLIDKHH